MFSSQKNKKQVKQNQPLKIHYLCCRESPQHSQEYLNYVCLQKGCSKIGLICSLCRQNHKDHSTIPLKFLLAHLKDHRESPMQTDDFSSHLQNIQNIKASMLYELKVCVENLAYQFQKLELEVIEKFKEIKIELLEQIQLNMKFEEIIITALESEKITNEQEYKKDFKKIAKWIQYINQDKKQIRFKIFLEDIVERYSLSQVELEKKLNMIQLEIVKEMQRPWFKNIPVLQEKKLPSINISNSKEQIQKIKYTYSAAMKGASINLDKNRKVAKQSASSPSRFVMVQQGLGLKNQKIVFKITKLANWIGIGICMVDKITAIGYQFKYEKPLHGSFLLSNNGYTWSHSQPTDNVKACQFNFHEGHTIELTLSEKYLKFWIRETAAEFKININLNQQEWKNVCFCVNLCSAEDSVEIVDQ